MKRIGYTCILAALSAFLFAGCSRDHEPDVRGRGSLKELRLMTINVWSGLDYKGMVWMGEYEPKEDREKRFRALVDEIRRLSPDVIGINEANPLPEFVDRLAEETGYDRLYHVGVSGIRIWRAGLPWNLREGDAILAKKDLGLECAGRKQLSGGGLVWNCLSFHTQDATQVVLGKIRLRGEDVYIATTHWHASPPHDPSTLALLSRLQQEGGYPESALAGAKADLASDCRWRIHESDGMRSFLEEAVPPGKKIVILGDFNATADSPEMQRLFSTGYRDTFTPSTNVPGYTWDMMRNSNIRKYYCSAAPEPGESLYERLYRAFDARNARIDFILINRAWPGGAVKESGLCCTGYRGGVQPSDHFGVFSIIKLE